MGEWLKGEDDDSGNIGKPLILRGKYDTLYFSSNYLVKIIHFIKAMHRSREHRGGTR